MERVRRQQQRLLDEAQRAMSSQELSPPLAQSQGEEEVDTSRQPADEGRREREEPRQSQVTEAAGKGRAAGGRGGRGGRVGRGGRGGPRSGGGTNAPIATAASTTTVTPVQPPNVTPVQPPNPAEISGALVPDALSEEEEDLCCICFERPRDAIIVHGESGHECCCFTCAKQLQECPVCRMGIDTVIRHFRS